MTLINGIAIGIFVGFILAIWRWDPMTEEAIKQKDEKFYQAAVKTRTGYEAYEQQITNLEVEMMWLKRALEEKDQLITEIRSKLDETSELAYVARIQWEHREPGRMREGVEIYG